MIKFLITYYFGKEVFGVGRIFISPFPNLLRRDRGTRLCILRQTSLISQQPPNYTSMNKPIEILARNEMFSEFSFLFPFFKFYRDLPVTYIRSRTCTLEIGLSPPSTIIAKHMSTEQHLHEIIPTEYLYTDSCLI